MSVPAVITVLLAWEAEPEQPPQPPRHRTHCRDCGAYIETEPDEASIAHALRIHRDYCPSPSPWAFA